MAAAAPFKVVPVMAVVARTQNGTVDALAMIGTKI
jgi:hypothetical protein